jgi:hypothetical protein
MAGIRCVSCRYRLDTNVSRQPSRMIQRPSRRSWRECKLPLGGIRYQGCPAICLIMRYRHEPSPQRFSSTLESVRVCFLVVGCWLLVVGCLAVAVVDVSALHTRAAFAMSATRSPPAKRSRVGERTLLACLRCKQKKLKVGDTEANHYCPPVSRPTVLTLHVSATAKVQNVKIARRSPMVGSSPASSSCTLR